MWMIIPATIAAVLFAIFLLASLQLRFRLVYLIGIFLLAYAQVVLTIEIASLLNRITPLTVLALQFFLTFLAVIVWNFSKKPPLSGPFHKNKVVWDKIPSPKKYPHIFLLAIVVISTYIFGVFIFLTTPYNNYDSMTYHLSRIGYWLQNKSLFPWETNNLRQTYLPMNAEIGVMWTMLFWGKDQLAGFVQWFSGLFLVLPIMGITRLLGAKKSESLFLGLLFLTFPQVFLQSITTMTDLTAGMFFVSGVYFLLVGWIHNDKHVLWLCGLALSLAVGTKSTAAIMTPGLFLALVILVIKNKVYFKQKILNLVGAGLISFILLGSISYIQNSIYYGHPFTPPELQDYFSAKKPHPQVLLERQIIHFAQVLDSTGLPNRFRPVWNNTRMAFFQPLLQSRWFTENQSTDFKNLLQQQLYHPPYVHEDGSWFGPLFPLMFFPSAVFYSISGFQKRNEIPITIISLLISFSIFLSLTKTWLSPFEGRYYTMIAPLAVCLMLPWLQIGKIFSKVEKYITTIVLSVLTLASSIILVNTLLFNGSKPLIGENNLWNLKPTRILTIHTPRYYSLINSVDKIIPENSSLAVLVGPDTWDYPFFGPRLERQIIQITKSHKNVNSTFLRNNNIDFLLMEIRTRPGLGIPIGTKIFWENSNFRILKVCKTDQCQDELGFDTKIFSQPISQGIVFIDSSIIDKIRLIDFITGTWGVEFYEGKPFYWLGKGNKQGLGINLFSKEALDITLIIEVGSGPSKVDPQRQLILTYNNQPEILPFSELTELVVNLTLKPGSNYISLTSFDEPDIVVSEAETRSLLIQLFKILITE